MQGFRYSLRPLWLFWGVIEEESLFAEIKFLKTKEKLGVYPSLVLLLSFSCEKAFPPPIPQNHSNSIKKTVLFCFRIIVSCSICQRFARDMLSCLDDKAILSPTPHSTHQEGLECSSAKDEGFPSVSAH